MGTSTPVHLAIADEHTIARKGIIKIISSFGGYKTIIEANNGRELLRKLSGDPPLPDICIMDINTPTAEGFETISQLKEKHPGIKVLVLAMFDNIQYMLKLEQSGINGYLYKNCVPEDLKDALKQVHHNNYYYPSGAPASIPGGSNEKVKVTAGERELLALCCTELTYKEIAAKMKLSARVVDSMREGLFKKLSVVSRTGLVMYALKAGIAYV